MTVSAVVVVEGAAVAMVVKEAGLHAAAETEAAALNESLSGSLGQDPFKWRVVTLP